MKIEIIVKNKYLYIYSANHSDKKKQLAYFEHFEDKQKKNVIHMSIEDQTGEDFVKENNYCIMDADVYWFSSKKLVYKAMFVFEKNGAFHNLVLITPKLLKIHAN